LHLSEDRCPKCGWKAPAGLLKCPFCKTYIRKPGSSSSTELKVPDAAALERAEEELASEPSPAESEPEGPAPDPKVVRSVTRKVTREVSRALFDDSDTLGALEKSDPFESDATERLPDRDPGEPAGGAK
jgi:hypothetical protein